MKNAKTLQEDILRSKDIANNILRQSEAPDISGELIKEAENKTEFLAQETQYNKQLRDVLASIQYVNELLNEVEQASKELRILDSLRLLESECSYGSLYCLSYHNMVCANNPKSLGLLWMKLVLAKPLGS